MGARTQLLRMTTVKRGEVRRTTVLGHRGRLELPHNTTLALLSTAAGLLSECVKSEALRDRLHAWSHELLK